MLLEKISLLVFIWAHKLSKLELLEFIECGSEKIQESFLDQVTSQPILFHLIYNDLCIISLLQSLL